METGSEGVRHLLFQPRVNGGSRKDRNIRHYFFFRSGNIFSHSYKKFMNQRINIRRDIYIQLDGQIVIKGPESGKKHGKFITDLFIK